MAISLKEDVKRLVRMDVKFRCKFLFALKSHWSTHALAHAETGPHNLRGGNLVNISHTFRNGIAKDEKRRKEIKFDRQKKIT